MTTTPDLAALAGKLSQAQRRIVDESVAQSESDTPFLSFKHIAETSGVAADEVGPAVRDLAALGVMRFERGLMTDEGRPYGSGYCLTDGLGLALRNHLKDAR